MGRDSVCTSVHFTDYVDKIGTGADIEEIRGRLYMCVCVCVDIK